ncbi:MAG TPA: glycoside hydrolase, partial [Gammaproteobacteria bacterium]|nr:glycoside hydrolase [Gammaproteobacteria bacterium]
PNGLGYISDQFLIDLVVWYHLAWLAEVERQHNSVVESLMEQAHNFTIDDRLRLVKLLSEWVNSIIPRYSQLAIEGRIELSTTPYSHPILPLLLDLNCTREAMPEAPLPGAPTYPGGLQRARWQIAKAQEVFTRVFNRPAKGIWPAEGGVSSQTLVLLGEAGIKWTASGQGVLANSLAHQPLGSKELHVPYTMSGSPACFFRDDELSDQIGFVYRHWHADDAVANFIHRIKEIANCEKNTEHRIVSIILDGENAWEYYPHNGVYFLSALYQALVKEPQINLTTFDEYLNTVPQPQATLNRLSAGSWVYGNFATWIGDKDKNRAWDMLCDAKTAFDTACASGKLSPKEIADAEQQLAYCEASDWFWWLGDHNPEVSVAVFERLFRLHLSALYVKIKAHAPDYLSRSFAKGVAQGKVETMRPSK